MKKIRVTALACGLMVSAVTPIAVAQSIEDVVVTRFSECLSAEGGDLGDSERAALTGLAPQLIGALGQPACDSGDAAGCTTALSGMSCELLAGVWHTPVAAAVPEPAPWARQFVEALTGRIVACLPNGTTDAQLGAQVAEYGLVLGSSLQGALTAAGCTPDGTQAAACATAITSVDCESLTQGVTSGGMMPLPEGAAESCGAMFGCLGSLDAAMDEIDRERGALRLGEDSP
jgi:hypothetical protein